MRGVAVRMVLGVALLLVSSVAGCMTPRPSIPFQPDPPNPFVDEICKQEVLVFKENGKEIKPNPPMVNPDLVLREIPLGTSLAEPRAFMERHGFTCVEGVKDNYQNCLYCRAYRRKTEFVADRVAVKFYYEGKRIVNVAVTVELNLKRSNSLFPEF